MIKNVNKIKPENYNLKQIMYTGNSFLDAAKKCNDTPTVEVIGWSHPLTIPIITNTAFACELFLKAMLQKNNITVKSHKLIDLFDKLPKDVKNNIIGTREDKIFIDELNSISSVFEEWRYIYERQPTSLNYQFLMKFAEELSSITEKVI